MNKNQKMPTKKTILNFKVGDKVTTPFYRDDEYVVRTITRIEDDIDTGSTRMIWADDGGKCECCERPFSKSTPGIDGAWFIPYESKDVL